MSDKPDERFLDRWSRLKKAGGAQTGPGSAVDAQAMDQIDRPADDGPRATAEPQSGAPHDAGAVDETRPLPAIEDLTADTDITGFLRKGVPEELQRLALRRMWALDPGIRDFIEVAENQYNWNLPGGVPGFGELEPGTDISALLAQATGAGRSGDLARDATAGEAAEAAAHGGIGEHRTLETAAAEATSAAPDAGVPASQTTDPVDDPGSDGTAAGDGSGEAHGNEPVEGVADLPAVRRKRHGGALPT